MQDQLTQSRLKELLDYEPETGVFRWKVVAGRGPCRRNPGDVAGSVGLGGYVTIRFGGKSYYAHRLAFLWMTGAWPEHEVDHIDGVRTDNRWMNLRETSRKTNAHNTGGLRANNTSGLVGASWHKQSGRWRAAITLNNRVIHIGLFATIELAHAAYLKAKDELHPTHRRLRSAA